MSGKQIYLQENLKTKVDFEEIHFSELEPLVVFAFGQDPELLNKYQQIPGDFRTMVDRNMKNIGDGNAILDLTCFKIMYKDLIIGFMVIDIGKNILYSFGININYRRKEILIGWVESVKSFLKGLVRCPLWNENQRAIGFMVKNGFEISNVTKSITYLTYL